MCGRYRLSPEDYEDLKDLVDSVDQDLDQVDFMRDQTPGGPRAILSLDGKRTRLQAMTWGYPSFNGGLLINARAETVLEKKTFREGFLNRRLVVPMSSFYEYTRAGEPRTFYRQGTRTYVAGFYDYFEGENHFILLTRPAQDPVSRIHPRMPLVLGDKDLAPYLDKASSLEPLLQEDAPLLKIKSGDQQLDFFSGRE